MEREKEKLISVLTPSYDGEKYLDKYFDSLLGQTYSNFEVIFVNDGSSDKTEEIVMKYKEELKLKNIDLTYIYQENMGQAAAVNNGLKYVKGEYLVWPDVDDYYEYDALENMITYLTEHENHDYVRGKVRYIDYDTQEEIGQGGANPEQEISTDLFLDYILEHNTYCFTGVIMIKMKAFEERNFGREIYVSSGGQNYQMILPVLYKGQGGYIDKIVYNYIVRKDSHSHMGEEYRKILDRTYVHEDTLLNVVKKIVTSKKEKVKYVKIIKKKYFDKRLRLRLHNNFIWKFFKKILKNILRRNNK